MVTVWNPVSVVLDPFNFHCMGQIFYFWVNYPFKQAPFKSRIIQLTWKFLHFSSSFLFGTQVTLSCATKLSSKDQGWQQIKMTGINSWWLPRYKLVIVTFELSQLVFNHTLQSFEIIINLLSWSKVKSQDWIYQHVLKCWSKCKCSLSMHFIIIIVFLFFFLSNFCITSQFFSPNHPA